jgi:hypothetical protein
VGKVDTASYGFAVDIFIVADRTYSVYLRSQSGDFYLRKSVLNIGYLPVPERGTLALFGLCLADLGAACRPQKA